MDLKVEILSRNLVKPSSPTPKHLGDYNLSLLDQFIAHFHCGIVLFYSPTKTSQSKENFSHSLQKSLSETLTDFYPIAGRHKDASTIDCNDEGAYFVEAKIKSNLSNFLNQPMVEKVVPTLDPKTMQLASKCLLIVQLTTFECQGVAISFCLDHRFCDFSSVVTFLKSWSSRARGAQEEEVGLPDFVGASNFLPPKDLPPLPFVPNSIEKRTTTRLVFDASKIVALKENCECRITILPFSRRCCSSSYSQIRHCCNSITASSPSSSTNPSVFFRSVNLRERTKPPLLGNSMGNLIWMLPVFIQEKNIEFHKLVAKMRRKRVDFYKEKVHKIKGDNEGVSLVLESVKERGEIINKAGKTNAYFSSSWCRFPMYEMDFGLGKPIWVSNGVFSSTNIIVLGDTKCGTGIEAWVTLDAQVAALFQHDLELLSFSSLNPSVLRPFRQLPKASL